MVRNKGSTEVPCLDRPLFAYFVLKSLSCDCTLYCRTVYKLHGRGGDEEVINPIQVLRVIETDLHLAPSFAPHMNNSHLGTERTPQFRLSRSNVWVDCLRRSRRPRGTVGRGLLDQDLCGPDRQSVLDNLSSQSPLKISFRQTKNGSSVTSRKPSLDHQLLQVGRQLQ